MESGEEKASQATAKSIRKCYSWFPMSERCKMCAIPKTTIQKLCVLNSFIGTGWKTYLLKQVYIAHWLQETIATWILPVTEMTRALSLERLKKDSIRLLVSSLVISLKERMEISNKLRNYLSQLSKFLHSLSWLHFSELGARQG